MFSLSATKAAPAFAKASRIVTGADVATLGHLLGESATVAGPAASSSTRRGACTPTSVRSRVSSFTRGGSAPNRSSAGRRWPGPEPLAGHGLHFISRGACQQHDASADDAECVAGLIRELLDAAAAWVDDFERRRLIVRFERPARPSCRSASGAPKRLRPSAGTMQPSQLLAGSPPRVSAPSVSPLGWKTHQPADCSQITIRSISVDRYRARCPVVELRRLRRRMYPAICCACPTDVKLPPAASVAPPDRACIWLDIGASGGSAGPAGGLSLQRRRRAPLRRDRRRRRRRRGSGTRE